LGNTKKNFTLCFITFISLSLLLFAADKKSHEAWMKQAMEKEQRRAKESIEHYSNNKRFEQKFGWIKEKHPRDYDFLMNSMKEAAKAWEKVLAKAKTAKDPKELTETKFKAYDAADQAHLAEITLKLMGGPISREYMQKHKPSKETKSMMGKMTMMEMQLIDAHRGKIEASAKLRKLEYEYRKMSDELRETHDKNRKEAYEKERKDKYKKH
jgi:hypothetical protein